MTRVIETVVARTGLEKFAVASILGGVPITLTYAAKCPQKVTRLILSDGWTQSSELEQSPAWQAERALRGKDWVIYSETFARVLMGYEDEDEEYAHEFAKYLRACVEPDAHRAAFDAFEQYDVSALLPGIAVPTLVVHNQNSENDFMAPPAVVSELAGAIPQAEFIEAKGATHTVHHENPDWLVKTIVGWLAEH